MKSKPKDCPICEHEYMPRNSLQRTCYTVKCALEWNRRQDEKARVRRERAQEKAERQDLLRRKEGLKGRREWTKDAQKAFNAYIRARDAGKPCISSGRMEEDRFTGGHFDAGHYRSTGAAPHLRFNTFNCHAQSKHDNRDKSGNVVEYRIRLIDRIGVDRVEMLEQDNTIRRFDVEYLRRVKKIFNRRARHLRKLRGNS